MKITEIRLQLFNSMVKLTAETRLRLVAKSNMSYIYDHNYH